MINEATVFIGICTFASSEIDSGLFAIIRMFYPLPYLYTHNRHMGKYLNTHRYVLDFYNGNHDYIFHIYSSFPFGNPLANQSKNFLNGHSKNPKIFFIIGPPIVY